MNEKDINYPASAAVTPHILNLSDEDEDHGVNIRSYLLAVLNRRWMILAITVLLVIFVGIYSKLQTPVYRAKTVLDIDLPSRFVSDLATQPSYWRSRDPFMKTQFRLLKGKELSLTVAEKLNLRLEDLRTGSGKNLMKERPKPTQAEIQSVASQLLEMVTVRPIPETTLCEILFTTPDPTLSMVLAETWAHEYVEQHMNAMQQYTRKAGELLSEQVSHLQNEIAQKEKMLFDYSLEKNIIKPDKSRSMASSAVTEVNSALNTATRERITAEVRYSALKSATKESLPDVMTHPLVQNLEKEISYLEQTYREKSKTYKPDYPEMARLRSNLEQMERSLDQARAKAYEEVLASARADVQRAYANERALQKQLDKASQRSVESGRKELDYDNLLMDIENKKLLLTSLLQKQNETDVSARVQDKAGNTRIIERPELPKSIFKPNIRKNLFLALMGGLVLGIALAIGLEFFDRSIKSADDVETYLRLPFLGVIPRYSGVEGNGHKNGNRTLMRRKHVEIAVDGYVQDLLSANDPMSYASEAIKTVRTSILLASPEAPPRTILVTSSRAGEGKTFIACNLAIALTQLDKRVVLIDADMRNPRVHRIWNAENNIGLSIYLTSDIAASAMVRQSSVNDLFFISSGPSTPRPAELLASARFRSLIQELKQDYDFIILDSPPILPVADSVILGACAEGVLLVVHGGETSRDIVKMAKKKLSAANPVILGTIVNGIDFTDPYYYYRYYSKYSYGYYGDQKASKEPA